MFLHDLFERLSSSGLGPFQGDWNPRLLPFFLAAALIPLFILGRELLWDASTFTRGSEGRGALLARNVRSDLLIFALQISLLLLAWLAFSTPPDRLPMNPPSPGSDWLFLPAQPVYTGIAYLVHGVLALYPAQMLLWIWIAYTDIDFLQTPRAMRIINLVFIAVVVVAWEADRWPVALSVPAELFLIPGVMSLLSQLIGAPASSRALGHLVQRLAQIGLTAACVAAIWIYHGLAQPLNLLSALSRGGNVTFASVLVYAGVISLVVAIYGYLRPPGRVSRAAGQRGAQALLAPFEQGQFFAVLIYAVVVEGLILFALWLAYLTPQDRLPFGPPAPDASFLGIPWAAVYAGAAIIIHALLALLGASNLLSYWGSVVLPATARSLRNRLLVIVGYGVAIAGLVIQGSPLWLIIPVEIGLAALVSGFLATAIRYLLAPFSTRIGWRQMLHAEMAVRALTLFAAVGFITLSLSGAFPVNSAGNFGLLLFVAYLFGIYVTMVLIDPVVGLFLSVFKREERSHTVLSSTRWVITVPLVIILAIVGASGFYEYLGASVSLGYSVWLEAGAAAAACLLFRPLVDLALIHADAAEFLQQIRDNSLIEEGLNYLNRFGGAALARAPLPAGRTVAPTPKQSSEHSTSSASQKDTALMPAVVSGPLPSGRSAKKILQLRAVPFFLVLALAYHFVGADLNLGTILGGNNLPLVVGLVALVAGLLQLINSPVLDAPRSTIMLLMLVTILVISLMVVLSADPLTSAPLTLAGRAPLALLADRQYLEVTLNTALQEFLFLLTFGQVYYLFKAVLYGSQKAPPTSEEETKEIAKYKQDLADSGDEQMDQANPHRALALYTRSRLLDPGDAKLWRKCGYAQQRLQHYEDALGFYEEALKRDQENSFYWNDKGVALEFLKRYDEALGAYDQALRIEPNNYYALDNKGDALSQLGRFEEAVVAYQRAVALNPNATYWNDVGFARHNLRHYDEAIQAFDHALALQARDALTLRNKAESLIKGLHRYEDGLAVVKQSLDVDSDSVRGYALQGLALQGLGRQNDAKQAFKQALRFDAGATATWASRGDALVGLKRYSEALAAYERALKDTPHDPDAWQGKAEALRALGRVPEAREAEQHAGTVVRSEAPATRTR